MYCDGSAVKSRVLNSNWINEASNFETAKFEKMIYAEENRSTDKGKGNEKLFTPEILLDTTKVGQLIPIILIILTNKRVNLFRHNL